MLKLDRKNHKLQGIASKTLAEAKILERYDLQKMIAENPDIFFDELKINQKLVLIGQEVRPSQYVADSIDLLALDDRGCAVIIELKRAESKLQLFQALSYAAMLSDWTMDDFIEVRSGFSTETSDEARVAILDKLESQELEINRTQSVILIAESFDYALLRTAEWLSEKYEVTIRCYRIEYLFDEQSELLSLSLVYPPREIVEHASRARLTKVKGDKAVNWQSLIQSIQNPAVKEFFERENIVGEKVRRGKAFRVSGQRRFWVGARKQYAYVWQRGRFSNDLEFWKKGLSNPAKVEPVEDESCVRFYLENKEDFEYFENAISRELQKEKFQDEAEIISPLERGNTAAEFE